MSVARQDERPTVSVATITYNHGAFIAQCVRSVLDQRANFSIEHVIGEDCSTDDTRAILQSFAAENPDRIRLLLREQNVGMRRNWEETLMACRGRYIAVVEGDDACLSPDKLARQARFLDEHPDFSICFHRVRSVDERTGEVLDEFPHRHPPVSSLDDLLRGNFIGTPSVMYRAGIVGALPRWSVGLRSLDWLTHILHAQHGKIGFLDDTMSLYRVHSGGVWTSLVPERRWLSELEMLRQLDAHLGFRHHAPIAAAIALRHFLIAHARADADDIKGARTQLALLLQQRPQELLMGRRAFVELMLRLLPGMRSRFRSPPDIYIPAGA